MRAELAVEAMEHWSLGCDLSGLSANALGRSIINDIRVLLDNGYTKEENTHTMVSKYSNKI